MVLEKIGPEHVALAPGPDLNNTQQIVDTDVVRRTERPQEEQFPELRRPVTTVSPGSEHESGQRRPLGTWPWVAEPQEPCFSQRCAYAQCAHVLNGSTYSRKLMGISVSTHIMHT